MAVRRISDEVYAKTENLRHELEAKFVAKQDHDWIKNHYQGVTEKRGFAAMKRLEKEVMKINGRG